MCAIRKELRALFKDFGSVLDDQWTWTTQSGDIYEDAEIEKIEPDQLILRHRFGTSRVDIADLSETSRRLLLHTPQWNAHLSSVPIQGKIAPFTSEPVHHAVQSVHAVQAA